jgi:predicted dehydrogenase
MANKGESRGPIRVGLVGIGNWARNGHIPVLSLLPHYKLSTIYSQRREAAEEAAAEYGFPYVANTLDELVNHPEVDLVVILTTAPQHEEAIRAAVAARKDVYSEWPLTPSTASSEDLVRLAHAAGVRTTVGLHRRLAPHNRYLADLLKEGYVGRLRSVRMHISVNWFQPVLPKALRWTVPPQNFSSMVAIFVGHYLDMLFSATGWPDSVSALGVNQFPKVTIAETGEVITTSNPDEFMFVGTLPDSAVVAAHFEGGKRNGSGVQIDLTGTEGDIRITNTSAFGGPGDDYVMTGARGDKLPLEPLRVPAKYDGLPQSGRPSSVMELAQNYVAISHDIRKGTRIAPTFSDAVRVHRLIDAAMASSKTGCRIAINSGDDYVPPHQVR